MNKVHNHLRTIQCAKKYCKDDVTLIENYDKMMQDTTQVWCCHHRGEVLPCGKFSVDDLKNFGLYWSRPASEFIFMTLSDHTKLHAVNMSDEHKQKISKAKTGKHHSEAAKLKMSESKTGVPKSEEHKKNISKALKIRNIGRHWYNNGVKNVFCKECPEGFVKGRLKI